MSTTRVGNIAALIAGLALTASPALAQDRSEAQPRGGRRNPDAARSGGDNGGARNRGGNRNGDQAERGNRNGDQAQRSDGGNRGGDRTERADRSAAPRPEAVPRERYENRDNNNGDRGHYDNRDRDRGRPVVVVPRYRDNRYSPRYAPRYYSRPNRVYVVPYGYRPQGYRPGWSLNLYFGRPYGGYYNRGYGYPGYNAGYGYYAIQPGFAYGSLRIVDAPRDAEVFVDGYYAGIVDDYDGVFQHLNLEPGTHHIEIDVYPGQPPMEFDVNVAPGQTVTFHARY